MGSLEELERRLESVPGFKEEYEEQYPFEDIALSVARLRAENGMTQEEFADRVGLKQPQVSLLESGKHGPNAAQLKQIADAFGLKLGFVRAATAPATEVELLTRREVVAALEFATPVTYVHLDSSATLVEHRAGSPEPDPMVLKGFGWPDSLHDPRREAVT